MKSLLKSRRLFLGSLFLSFAAIGYAGGCTAEQIESGARDVQHVAGGAPLPPLEPTSQPTTQRVALDTGRVIVQGASATVPGVKEIATIVGIIAGAVGTIAGNQRGKRTGEQRSMDVVSEIITDVHQFKNPNIPWTEKTANVLRTLGFDQRAS